MLQSVQRRKAEILSTQRSENTSTISLFQNDENTRFHTKRTFIYTMNTLQNLTLNYSQLIAMYSALVFRTRSHITTD